MKDDRVLNKSNKKHSTLIPKLTWLIQKSDKINEIHGKINMNINEFHNYIKKTDIENIKKKLLSPRSPSLDDYTNNRNNQRVKK